MTDADVIDRAHQAAAEAVPVAMWRVNAAADAAMVELLEHLLVYAQSLHGVALLPEELRRLREKLQASNSVPPAG